MKQSKNTYREEKATRFLLYLNINFRILITSMSRGRKNMSKELSFTTEKKSLWQRLCAIFYIMRSKFGDQGRRREIRTEVNYLPIRYKYINILEGRYDMDSLTVEDPAGVSDSSEREQIEGNYPLLDVKYGRKVRKGTLIELGVYGLLIEVDAGIVIGDWMEIKFILPNTVVPVVIVAEAIHIARLPGKGKRFKAGVRILELRANDSQRIKAYLKQRTLIDMATSRKKDCYLQHW
jgi:hypothetical protein